MIKNAFNVNGDIMKTGLMQTLKRCLFHQRIIILYFCCLCLMFYLSSLCRAETVAIIPIYYRNASDALPIVKSMLSPNGTATIDARTNSLIITDNDQPIKNIRTFLKNYDQAVQQVRIRVKFNETASTKGRSVLAEGGVSGEKWKITTGRKEHAGIDIHVNDREAQQQGLSEYFITVASGSSAYILTGQDIPYRQRWIYLSQQYAGWQDTVVFQKIETGLEVRPVLVGDQANIEITPRISYEDSDGSKGIIRFTKAATSLTVPLGQWVNIGGTADESNEVIKAILERGSGKKDSSTSISLLVEKY